MRVLLVALALLLSSSALAHQDVLREIVLASGEVIVGVVVEEGDDGLVVRVDGDVREIAYDDIRYVRAAQVPDVAPMPPRIDESEPQDREETSVDRRERRRDPLVEPWRRASRDVGLGVAIPMFSVGVGVVAAATPAGSILGVEVFYGMRTTGTLLMGGFLPAALTGAALSRVALKEAGGAPPAGAVPVVVGSALYGAGLGLMMVALDWPAFTEPWVAAPFGFASIPMVIVGAVALCADVDQNTRLAHALGVENERRRRRAAALPIPWMAPRPGGATGGFAFVF